MADSSSAHKLVIIGSGPAGWTAAIYAARAQLDPIVYVGVAKNDPGPVLPGGQLMLTTEVENYPGFVHGIKGPEMMEIFRHQAERFGTKVVGQDIVSCDFTQRPFVLKTSEGDTVRAHSVVIATGAVANWIGLPNEMRLARSGGGVSACAVCDGALPPFRKQPLAVVGGGDTAMEEATYLTKFASAVYVIHRRDSLRASKIMQERYFSQPNAKVIWNKVVVDVLGDEFIEGVLLEDTVTKERSRLDVRGLFVAIGHTPATRFLLPPRDEFEHARHETLSWYQKAKAQQASGEGSLFDRVAKNPALFYEALEAIWKATPGRYVELNEKGYINLATRGSRTNIPGVFAAGDVADAEYRQAITAAGMGCQAALDAERWLAASGIH